MALGSSWQDILSMPCRVILSSSLASLRPGRVCMKDFPKRGSRDPVSLVLALAFVLHPSMKEEPAYLLPFRGLSPFRGVEGFIPFRVWWFYLPLPLLPLGIWISY